MSALPRALFRPTSGYFASDSTEGIHDEIVITVLGEAKTAGSKRAFVNPKTGRAIITDDNKHTKSWQQEVRQACMGVIPVGHELLTGALCLSIVFYKPRPASHYGTGRNRGVLKPAAPLWPATRPDVLKLARAVEDALSGVLYRDDAQIVSEHLAKRFGEPARCEIRVRELT